MTERSPASSSKARWRNLAVAVALGAVVALPALLGRSASRFPSRLSAPTAPKAASVQSEESESGSRAAPVPPGAVAGSSEPSPPKELSGDSTLAEWREAAPAERSHVAVGIARSRLPAGSNKLDLAKAAMEINGCLTATARDRRLGSWKVGPTAATCLGTAENKPR